MAAYGWWVNLNQKYQSTVKWANIVSFLKVYSNKSSGSPYYSHVASMFCSPQCFAVTLKNYNKADIRLSIFWQHCMFTCSKYNFCYCGILIERQLRISNNWYKLNTVYIRVTAPAQAPAPHRISTKVNKSPPYYFNLFTCSGTCPPLHFHKFL